MKLLRLEVLTRKTGEKKKCCALALSAVDWMLPHIVLMKTKYLPFFLIIFCTFCCGGSQTDFK